jgi:hypothetical protein
MTPADPDRRLPVVAIGVRARWDATQEYGEV